MEDPDKQPSPLPEERPKGLAPEEARGSDPETFSVHELELDELRGYKDKYLRLLADSENTRKRLQKELQDRLKHAVADIITEFLGPIDQLEGALRFSDGASKEVQNWSVGFKMILSQFHEALASHGVHPFESVGSPFDPHKHEAVELVECLDQPPGTVVAEMVRGYRMGERTLRPARVKVARSPELRNNEEACVENLD